MSTAAEEMAASPGAGALMAAVGTTFGTYMLADFLSNFLQHPTQLVSKKLARLRSHSMNGRGRRARSQYVLMFDQRSYVFAQPIRLSHIDFCVLFGFVVLRRLLQMDYGYFNQFLGREVDRLFWGTRTQHIVGVAGCLAVTDHISQHLLSKYFLGGRSLCFAKSPAAFVAHTFFFIFSGVTLYVAGDAALNPDLQGRRMQAFQEGTYCSYVGSSTAWYEPYVSPALAKVAGPAVANTWFGSALLPATLAYTTVKGVGWTDWGNRGLNDCEMRLNQLQK